VSDVLCNTTHPPLVEPDVRISLIRLSHRLSLLAIAVVVRNDGYR
jgi:hypothetical protein